MAGLIFGNDRKSFMSLSHDEIDTITKFLRISTFINLCRTCKELKLFVGRPSYWEHFVKTTFLPLIVPWSAHSDLLRDYTYKGIVSQMMRELRVYDSRGFGGNIILSVEQVSSVDREDEAGVNVLETSFCQLNLKQLVNDGLNLTVNPLEVVAMTLQRECGCAGQFPCYWSSKPSISPDIKESMLFKLRSPLCAIIGFSVTPYRAYFHPSHPVYGPLSACLQFVIITTTDGRQEESMYFETPRFSLQNVDEAQEYFLPIPILSIGGMMRLVLHGMAQRQTIVPFEQGDQPTDGYYMCLSRVKILGVPIFKNHDEGRDYFYQHLEGANRSAGESSDHEEDEIHARNTYRSLT